MRTLDETLHELRINGKVTVTLLEVERWSGCTMPINVLLLALSRARQQELRSCMFVHVPRRWEDCMGEDWLLEGTPWIQWWMGILPVKERIDIMQRHPEAKYEMHKWLAYLGKEGD